MREKHKEYLFYFAMMVAGLILTIGLIYGLKLFNTATTPITVHQVENGVKCALAVTGDGVAIDCWQTSK